jgi:peptidoglycan-associated lipoprotein
MNLPTLLTRASIVLTAMLALSGCKKPEYPACKKDKHCKVDLGEKCVDGACQNCTTDTECAGKGPDGADWTCFEFRCVDPAEAAAGGGAGGGTGELGAPCTQKIDCIGGLVCTAGACSNCTDDVECAPSTCTIETGRCAASGSCTTDDECPMDEICDGGMCIFSGDYGEPGSEGPCGVDAVFFAFDSDKLTPATETTLTTLATCIAQNSSTVTLEAHADNVGTEEYNILLTERRGQNVKNFLTNAGAPAESLSVVAKGSLEATGSSEAERAKDRRVQFYFQ